MGLGTGPLLYGSVSDTDATRVIARAVELGADLIDVSRGDAAQHERVARWIAPVRQQVMVSAKIDLDAQKDRSIARAVDELLSRIGTDVIDIVYAHTSDEATIASDELQKALRQLVVTGKARAVGFAGENRALELAIACGGFQVVQTSLNICDQRAASSLERARHAGIGVIAKRPIANAPWRFAQRPQGHEAEHYWLRWRGLSYDPGDLDWHELALRFVVHHPAVTSAIVGTSSIENLEHNHACVDRGPLPTERFAAIRGRFLERGYAWESRR